MGRYNVSVKHSAVKEIEAILQKVESQRIIRRIGQLADDPGPSGSRMLSGHDRYRIRHGADPIVYSINDEEVIVLFVKAGHR